MDREKKYTVRKMLQFFCPKYGRTIESAFTETVVDDNWNVSAQVETAFRTAIEHGVRRTVRKNRQRQ